MTWFDTIYKKNDAKFVKDLEKKLNEAGYELVEYKKMGDSKFSRHASVVVKNPETMETVETPFTASKNNRAIKNFVSQVRKVFSGRRRRGQGSFKLSNDKINTWQSILKIQPKDNPLSDEFEPPEIPQKQTNLLDTEVFNIAQNQLEIFLLHEFKVEDILSNFPIAYKFFKVNKSNKHLKMLRVEGDKWIYDNSYLALAFNTQFDKSIINEHDLKSAVREMDLFLDAVLEFYLTIDSNYEERTEAIEVYATAIYEFLVGEYKGYTRREAVIEGTVDEAMEILESFGGKVKPLEVVIRQTMEDIKEGDTEIDWETLSELYDTDFAYEIDLDEEAESREGMSTVDYEELTTEEELRRRRNRG